MLADRTPFVALVVEDEWLVRSEIVDELKAYGLHVLEASSGEAALQSLRYEPNCKRQKILQR